MDIISSNHVDKFYSYVNDKLGSTKTVHPTKIGNTNNNNNLTDSPTERAITSNDYFSSVFTVDNGITLQVKPRIDNTTFC